ncbi:MAG: VWA domain-containing protein [Polyangiaceae bacterium]|nr:VWA domain-containing protein [Polyangiaceae bacterium]
MKSTHVGMLSALGMLLVGGAVFAITPAGGFGATKERPTASSDTDDTDDDNRQGSTDGGNATTEGATFSVSNGPVLLDARLGHSSLLAAAPDETYVMLELRGDEKAGGTPPVAALSLVIDKSGSMRGTRFSNAIQAAVTAVQQLRDGDSVSVVAFDTRSEKVVPLTVVNPSTRQNVIQSIRNIQLGGDTCVSCGIEDGLADLRTATAGNNTMVQRMILLSDGAANNGIRDVPGFKGLGQRALSQGVNIAAIGVDVDFDEKVLSALATSSNGRHYFVENDVDLVRVFEQEAASVGASVASNTVAEIELAPGVELVRVFDRQFSRAGSRLSVPLGTFAKGEVKTVLAKVRIPKGKPGSLSVANVRLTYRDLGAEKDATSSGKLAALLVDDKDALTPIDAIVLDRLQRSETATALREANNLFSVGKADEARKRLEDQKTKLSASRSAATNAPAARAGDINKSFDKQEQEISRSIDNFATPPPPDAAAPAPPAGQPAPAPAKPKAQMKRNAAEADAFGF